MDLVYQVITAYVALTSVGFVALFIGVEGFRRMKLLVWIGFLGIAPLLVLGAFDISIDRPYYAFSLAVWIIWWWNAGESAKDSGEHLLKWVFRGVSGFGLLLLLIPWAPIVAGYFKGGA